MDESGDFSGDAELSCDPTPVPSTAMIAIMVVSMVCTMASAAKTLLDARKKRGSPTYDTFSVPPTEMLDLRLPYER
jgi:hypothetical protein